MSGHARLGLTPARRGAALNAMYRPHADASPEPVGFLLIPRFSMMAYVSAVEPLRVANRLSGRELFSWHAFSPDGGPVEASNGMRLIVDGPIEAAKDLPSLIVCAGFDPQKHESRRLLSGLRQLSRQGVTLGALDTGAHILAKARLIDDIPVTMHWEAVPAFQEEFPHITVSDELFEVQDRFFTCAGGTAALDLMLDMIGRKHGVQLAIAVSEQFIHDRIRDRHDHQRLELSSRLRVTNSRVLKIVNAMERHLEQPLDNGELADLAGVSTRQMERLFKSLLGASPSEYYRNLRLSRARQLLRQTDMSVLDVAVATGFSSASCLSRRYRAHFALAPREDRREQAGAGQGAEVAVSRNSA